MLPEYSNSKTKGGENNGQGISVQGPHLDCDAVIRVGSEEEILKKAAEHAKAVHNMKELPAEVVIKVRAAIREE